MLIIFYCRATEIKITSAAGAGPDASTEHVQFQGSRRTFPPAEFFKGLNLEAIQTLARPEKVHQAIHVLVLATAHTHFGSHSPGLLECRLMSHMACNQSRASGRDGGTRGRRILVPGVYLNPPFSCTLERGAKVGAMGRLLAKVSTQNRSRCLFWSFVCSTLQSQLLLVQRSDARKMQKQHPSTLTYRTDLAQAAGKGQMYWMCRTIPEARKKRAVRPLCCTAACGPRLRCLT